MSENSSKFKVYQEFSEISDKSIENILRSTFIKFDKKQTGFIEPLVLQQILVMNVGLTNAETNKIVNQNLIGDASLINYEGKINELRNFQ